MTKLDKLYHTVNEDSVDGKIVAKTYEAESRLLSFRTDPKFKPDYVPKKVISEEHLAKMKRGQKK